jgi:hypothetical protein
MLRHSQIAFAIALLALLPHCLQAQKKDKVEVDTVKVNFLNGIAVHADLLGAVQMLSSDHGQWEAGLRINIKDRYFPAFEIGIGEADESDEYEEESWCKARAPYFRIGCDYNVLRNKHDLYKAFVGLRYGFSKFNYDTTVKTVTETDGGDTAETGESTTTTTYPEYDGLDATCHWLEVVFGVDAKVWGPLHLGWDVRYRRMLSNKHSDIAAPWYIPGFGNDKTAGFAAMFNFTLAI